MVAAGVVVAGCASVDGDPLATTTGPVITETSGNPWDLPIEQRPALFDPCAEIPVEAVEQGVGGPVEPVEEYTRHEPSGLMVCGWATDEVDLSVLATWKSRDEYLDDARFTIQDAHYEVMGRPGLRVLDADEFADKTCMQIFFTTKGTIWVKLDLFGAFSEFGGKRFANPCESLDKAILPLLPSIPQGDFL